RTKNGRIELNPPSDTGISAEDAIVLIAEDDSSIALSEDAHPEISSDAIRKPPPPERRPERTLILGWNDRAPTIVTELDHYVDRGSEVTVVTPEGAGPPPGFDELEHQTVTFHTGNTTDRRTLEGLGVPSYDHVIVLGRPDEPDHNAADSGTLITLLHLREIADKSERPFSIVSEMLDVRNRELAEITRADDFIVSDHLASLTMCQVSENKELSAMFEKLIEPEGSELYLKPAAEYVTPGVQLNFYTVVEAARRRGEVAVGYRVKAETDDPNSSYGVHLNPDKSRRIALTEHDKLIVLAES
ncbi:MAG: potassium transporter TrkA, partial [Rubrobacteraceae bacterium]|nr:potassium transporter TrkA [Rubrobacteraceae bacterium]